MGEVQKVCLVCVYSPSPLSSVWAAHQRHTPTFNHHHLIDQHWWRKLLPLLRLTWMVWAVCCPCAICTLSQLPRQRHHCGGRIVLKFVPQVLLRWLLWTRVSSASLPSSSVVFACDAWIWWGGEIFFVVDTIMQGGAGMVPSWLSPDHFQVHLC